MAQAPVATDDDVRRWAAATWRCLAATTDDATGLPADGIDDRLDPATRPTYTSPTNIGGYLWSAVAAGALGLADGTATRDRCARTLATLAGLPRHEGSGMFYNWYDVATGARTTTWGRRGRRLAPFLSSIDNAWLVLGLRLVAQAYPELRGAADQIVAPMRFDAYYDPAARPAGGLMRGGFWESAQRNRSVPATDPTGAPIHVTRHHYALLNSETRLVTYVAMALGQVGPQAYAALDAPVAGYAGASTVASLGGSVFEALAVAAFFPEEEWSPALWGVSHAGTVAAHRAYAAAQGWPAWGLSPCACPGRGSAGGYREFGVPPLGILGDGYRTSWRGQGVVTPHAAALSLPFEPAAAMANLAQLEALGCYGPGGFVDSLGVRTRRTAGRYLTLDQAFVLAGLAHQVGAGILRRLTVAAGAAGAADGTAATVEAAVAARTEPRLTPPAPVLNRPVGK